MNQMYCVITIRKDVADQAEGKRLFDAVSEKIADVPDIETHAHVTNHFSLQEAPE